MSLLSRHVSSCQRFLAGLSAVAFVFAQLALPASASAANGRKILYYHPDHLGSTNVVTDEAGQVVQVLEYAPYGKVVTNTGAVNVPHKFTGQRADSSTGLYYYKTRYYDPQLGRFTQPDPIVPKVGDPQALNRYSYVRNNPLRFIDPTGHGFWDWFKRIYLALLTWGQSEIMKLNASFLKSFSDAVGINPKYTFAAYSALLGAVTGGVGWGLGAAISGGLTAFGTNLALDSGEGRQLTRKVAKEFFMDVVGMSPQAAYAASSITLSVAVSAGIQLLASAAMSMRDSMIKQSKLNPQNSSGISEGHKGDHFKLGGNRFDPSNPSASPSPLGGTQGGQGEMFSIPYEPGSLQDKLIEAYAGPHDALNSWFGYDASGNIRQGMTALEKGFAGTLNVTDVVVATPFAAAGSLPNGFASGIMYGGMTINREKERNGTP